MEGCLLQDVFPDWIKNDTKASEKARKEQKKRAKKCRDPALRYLEPEVDPDRPSLVPLPDVLPMNDKTGMIEVLPKTEGFQDSGPSVPKYFGSSGDDEEEGFAPYTHTIGEDSSYLLEPPKKKEADYRNKSEGGELLPTPSLEDVWKPLTPAGAGTAFFQYLAPPGGEYPKRKKVAAAAPRAASESELSKKFDQIFQRLDQLEKDRKQSTQTEVLLFVGTGLALIVSLEFLTR
jgi:hypothetical protein